MKTFIIDEENEDFEVVFIDENGNKKVQDSRIVG